jgi:hypothetical protein
MNKEEIGVLLVRSTSHLISYRSPDLENLIPEPTEHNVVANQFIVFER